MHYSPEKKKKRNHNIPGENGLKESINTTVNKLSIKTFQRDISFLLKAEIIFQDPIFGWILLDLSLKCIWTEMSGDSPLEQEQLSRLAIS